MLARQAPLPARSHASAARTLGNRLAHTTCQNLYTRSTPRCTSPLLTALRHGLGVIRIVIGRSSFLGPTSIGSYPSFLSTSTRRFFK